MEEHEIWHKARMRAEALKIVTDVRDETLDLCIRTIESLYLDSQGLILDADTIDACANVLRSLKAGRRALAETGGGDDASK